MLTLTIQQTLDGQGDEADHPYRIYLIHDGAVYLYVGKSYDPYERLQEHLGNGTWGALQTSEIGRLILRHRPESLAWRMVLYSLADCEQMMRQWGIATEWCREHPSDALIAKTLMDEAERLLIAVCRPCLSIMSNPNPTPLPERYRRGESVDLGE